MSDRHVTTCEVCGGDGTHHAITVTLSFRESTVLCEFCQGLIDAGLIRRAADDPDGTHRYRQWHMGNWTPGELVPRPAGGGDHR